MGPTFKSLAAADQSMSYAAEIAMPTADGSDDPVRLRRLWAHFSHAK
jgi:hypothetical protein